MPRYRSPAHRVAYSSSSSSSSMSRNYRIKRPVLVTKRRRSTTQVFLWRMNNRPSNLTPGITETSWYRSWGGSAKDTEVTVSARKLANALHTLSYISSPITDHKNHRERNFPSDTKIRNHLSKFNPSRRPITELGDQGSKNYNKTCNEPSEVYPTELQRCFPGMVSGSKNCLKDLRSFLVSSKELLKMMIRFGGINKQQYSSVVSLASAVFCKLDQALVQVDQLVLEKKSADDEIRHLLGPFAKAQATRRHREQEGLRSPLESVIDELELEKKLRRAEWMNKRLEDELIRKKTLLATTVQELKNERKAREIYETSYEILKRIVEDKTEVEKLKKKSAKSLELGEKEMLQPAAELCEEKVLMRLSEEKCQFQQKNAAVNRLRWEPEVFPAAKAKEKLARVQTNVANYKENDCYRSTDRRDIDGEDGRGRNNGADSSEVSDLHPIELNINSGYNRSNACLANKDEDELALTNEKHKLIYKNFTRNSKGQELISKPKFVQVLRLQAWSEALGKPDGRQVSLGRTKFTPSRQ